MRGLIKSDLAFPKLWNGCVIALCPGVDRSRSSLLTDFSPGSNHGTLGPTTQAPSWSVSRGNAVLDFASASNQYVSIPVRETFQGDVSVSMWINPRTAGASGAGRLISLSGINIRLLTSGVLQSSSDNGGTNVSSTGTISFNSWNHVSVVRTILASSISLQFFINGILAGTGTPASITNINENTLGNVNNGFSYTRGAEALINDVRVYTRGLYAPEIKTLALRQGIAYEVRRRFRRIAPSVSGGISGVASGSLPLTGSATGTVLVQGVASGDLPLTGSSTGTVLVHGSASGSLPLTGSSTSTVLVRGSASGDLPLSGSATGSAIVGIVGTAVGDLPLTGSSTATVLIQGVASGSLPLTGSATGTILVQGVASGSLLLTGSATGSTISGSIAIASGDLPLTGIATGLVLVQGVAAGNLSLTGSASGTVLIRGSAAGNLSLTGNSTGTVFTPGGEGGGGGTYTAENSFDYSGNLQIEHYGRDVTYVNEDGSTSTFRALVHKERREKNQNEYGWEEMVLREVRFPANNTLGRATVLLHAEMRIAGVNYQVTSLIRPSDFWHVTLKRVNVGEVSRPNRRGRV